MSTSPGPPLQVERERVVTEDIIRSWDRAEFDRQFRRLEEENQVLQHQVEQLQAVLNESEHQQAQRYVCEMEKTLITFLVCLV